MILNKTNRSSNQYSVITGNMGSYGTPKDHPNNFYEVAYGLDRGYGYQGYESIESFLNSDSSPLEAQDNLKQFLRDKGFSAWVDQYEIEHQDDGK